MTQKNSKRRRFGGLVCAAVLSLALTAPWIAGASTSKTVAAKATPPVPKVAAPVEKQKKKYTAVEISEQLKKSTFHILSHRAARGVSMGTGTLIDLKAKHALTNWHVVADPATGQLAERLDLYPAVKRNGRWVRDPQYYLKNVKPIRARVISMSRQHDLALLELESLPEDAVALKLASTSPVDGEQLHSVAGRANGSSLMWPYTRGYVRAVGERTTAVGRRTRMIEAGMQTNKGNSGGPIVNDSLELVGICEGHVQFGRTLRTSGPVDRAELMKLLQYRVRDVSMYVDIEPIRAFLTDAKNGHNRPSEPRKVDDNRGGNRLQPKTDPPRSKKRLLPRFGGEKGNRELVGEWVLRRETDEGTLEITFDMRSNGQFTGRVVVQRYDGLGSQKTVSGTFVVRGETIVFRNDNGTEDTLRFRLSNGRLSLYEPKNGIWLDFDKVR